MTAQRLVLGLVLLAFGDLTAYAVYQHGYMAFFDLHRADAIQIQVFADLVIALSLVMLWMLRDARERGISAAPFVVATLFLGSIGPLLYLFRRTWTVEQRRAAYQPATHLA